MNQVININTTANSKNTFQIIAQSIFDFITFRALRDLFNIDFDITLNEEDVKHIEEQLWR